MASVETAVGAIEQEEFVSKRIVIKIGRSTITRGGDPFNRDSMGDVARQVTTLHRNGVKVAIVSSGAVAGGEKILKNKSRVGLRNRDVAVIGQQALIFHWRNAFRAYHEQERDIVEILVADADIKQSVMRVQLALQQGKIPIINGHPFNGRSAFCANNDKIAGWIARTIGADRLLLVTDVEGALENNQHHKPLSYVVRLEDIQGDMQETGMGIGGMWPKCLEAKKAAEAGIQTFIARNSPDAILTVAKGGHVGTQFLPGYERY